MCVFSRQVMSNSLHSILLGYISLVILFHIVAYFSCDFSFDSMVIYKCSFISKKIEDFLYIYLQSFEIYWKQGKKVMTNQDSILKRRDITFPTKACLVKAMVFPVVMYGCESWTTKKVECQRIDASELWCWRRLFRVPWTTRRSNQSHPKGNKSWIFIRRTDAETPILWPPDAKNWFIWKDPDAGKDWRQEEKGTTEDEMVGWHHRLNGHEFE